MKKLRHLLRDRRMLIVFGLGFSSGLPYLLIGSTLQAWCKDAGMDLGQIGLFALVGVPYTLKFLWSPLLDWFTPAFLGRRRGWLLLSQGGLFVTLLALAACNPHRNAPLVATLALVVALLSATQDIAVDAMQIELLPPEAYGLGNQLYILGYRLSMMVASGGAMILSDSISWRTVYVIMACLMSIGILTTLFATEPIQPSQAPRGFKAAVWDPIQDFFSPTGILAGRVWWVLAFFLLYKLGTDMATSLTTPFYMDLGFSKTQIGAVVKVFGLGATIAGGLIGGLAIVNLGVRRCLWIFGTLQALATLTFAWLAHTVHAKAGLPGEALSSAPLAATIAIENLASGLGTAAYATFMGMSVNKRFTATQYALLSSLMGATRVYSAAPSGFLAQALGWNSFFVLCTVLAIPGLLVLLKIAPPQNRAPAPVAALPETSMGMIAPVNEPRSPEAS